MSPGHAEIAHLVHQLGQLVDAAGGGIDGPGAIVAEEAVLDARRLLDGLQAVLQLHFAQEDECYLCLGPHDADRYGIRTGRPYPGSGRREGGRGTP